MTADVIQKVKEISAAATFAIGIVDRIAIQPGGDADRPDAASWRTAPSSTRPTRPCPCRSRTAQRVRQGAEGVVAAVAALPDIDAAPRCWPTAHRRQPVRAAADRLATPDPATTPTTEVTPEPTEAADA